MSQIESKTGGRSITLIVITTDRDVAKQCGVPVGNETCPAPKSGDRQGDIRIVRPLHETIPIVESLYLVRDSRLHITASQAIEDFHHKVIMLPLPPAKDGLKAPLGWALSEQVRQDILRCSRDMVRRQFPNAGPVMPAPDCSQ